MGGGANFGSGGATALEQGNKPYFKLPAYKDALAYEPDYVIIKLGTNDSKPQNSDKHKASYLQSYSNLVESFQKLPSQPKIYICLPVPVAKDSWGINEKTVAGEIIPMLKQFAKGKKLSLIDLSYFFHVKHS